MTPRAPRWTTGTPSWASAATAWCDGICERPQGLWQTWALPACSATRRGMTTRQRPTSSALPPQVRTLANEVFASFSSWHWLIAWCLTESSSKEYDEGHLLDNCRTLQAGSWFQSKKVDSGQAASLCVNQHQQTRALVKNAAASCL